MPTPIRFPSNYEYNSFSTPDIIYRTDSFYRLIDSIHHERSIRSLYPHRHYQKIIQYKTFTEYLNTSQTIPSKSFRKLYI